jgi:heat shock protein HslJ
MLAAASCADDGSGGTSGGGIEGVTWILDAASIGTLVDEAPESASVTLLIEAEQASGVAACNHYGGPVTIDGEAISFGTFAVTEMACEPGVMALEAAYLDALGQIDTFSVGADGSHLLLTGGTIGLSFAAEVPLPLVGTDWRLDGIAVGADAVSSTLAGTEATLGFDDAGQASGNASCNTFNGSYQVDGGVLSFGPLATTRMFCGEPGVMDQEQQVLAGLAATRSFAIQGSTLTLSDGSGAFLLSYVGG